MNTSMLNRYLGLVVSGVVAIAASACDDGGGTAGGAGGAGGSDAASATTGTPGSTTASTGTGTPAGGSLIDTMEDGDGSIAADAGRQGAWYTYNDETMGAMQTPLVGAPFTMTKLPEPRDGSMFGANTKGSGFTTWGAGFGFDLNNDGTAKGAYDASKYTGISFWAKVGTGSTKVVRFNVGDKNTTIEGGVCTPATCSDDFGQSLTLTESWQQFTIKFADMKAENWSKQNLKAIDASALYAVHFQAGKMTTFDLWIDDISFTE